MADNRQVRIIDEDDERRAPVTDAERRSVDQPGGDFDTEERDFMGTVGGDEGRDRSNDSGIVDAVKDAMEDIAGR